MEAANKRIRRIDNEEGFTLVEIIAVLVILGILAAVAVPKYFNLQDEAKTKALQGAMAEAIGQINQTFAKGILNGDSFNTIDYSTLAGPMGSDFRLDFIGGSGAPGTNQLQIKVTGLTGAITGNTYSKNIIRPGKL